MSLQAYKGTVTAPSSGTVPVRQSTTGVGFPPRAVIFYSAATSALNSSQTGMMECIGAMAGGKQFVVANASDGSGTTSNAGRYSRTTEAICLPLNGTPAVDALASCVSLDSDGFTLDWTDVAATSGLVVHYLALGGEDVLDAAVMAVTPTTTTNGATQAVVVGFLPDFLLTVSPAVPSATGIVDANICVGAAARVAGTQYATCWFENDGVAAKDCGVYSTTARAGIIPASTAAKDADYTITAWNADGFTITWNDAPTALTPVVYFLALRGGQYQIDALVSATATGTQAVSTSFAPRAMLFFGTSDPTDADTTMSTTTVDSTFTIGASDSALRQGANAFIQQDANASSFAKRRTSSTKAVTHLTGTTATLQSEASVSAVSASSYTLNWSTANATTKRFAGVAFGDSALQNPFVFNSQSAMAGGGTP